MKFHTERIHYEDICKRNCKDNQCDCCDYTIGISTNLKTHKESIHKHALDKRKLKSELDVINVEL